MNNSSTTTLTPAGLPFAMRFSLAVTLAFFAVLCLLGNALVLISLKRYPQLRTPANVILGSLATVDLLMALPLVMMVYSLATRDFKASDLQAGLMSTLVASASLHIGLISIDRFISIRYALKYITIVTMKRVCGVLVIIWSVAFTLVGLVLLLAGMLDSDPQHKQILFFRKPRIRGGPHEHQFATWVLVYKCLTAILFYCLPLLTILISYAYIGKVAYGKRRSICSEAMRFWAVHLKRTKTIFIVVAIFFIFNSPYVIVSMIYMLNSGLRGLLIGTLLISSLASCCNPFVYAYRGRHFKQAFKKILTCK